MAAVLIVAQPILQNKLGALFGGSKLWSAGVAADHLKDGLRGAGWDDAFMATLIAG